MIKLNIEEVRNRGKTEKQLVFIFLAENLEYWNIVKLAPKLSCHNLYEYRFLVCGWCVVV